MRPGPILRESLQIHILEGHGFAAYFYLMIVLTPVVFLTLFLPSLEAQVWIGPAQVFKVSVAAAMVLIAYFSLKVANQEFAPGRFVSLKRRLIDENSSPAAIAGDHLAVLALQILLLALLAAPLLVWAGAIARVPAAVIFSMFALIFFYAFVYGVWGLAALALWERKLETRQVFVRAFFIVTVFVSAAVYLPLNSIAFLLSFVEEKELARLSLLGMRWPAGAVHFVFHALLLGSGFWIYRRALIARIES
jgi:hypothetical protein